MKLLLFILTAILTAIQQDTYVVKSDIIRLNGATVQMYYVVKDADIRGSNKSVQLISKKLVDTKTGKVMCTLRITKEDEHDPIVKLSQINNTKLNANIFTDVNFDGYQDILESCDICSGSANSITDVYLFDPLSKTYNYWMTGSNIALDKGTKTASFQDNNDAKQFNYRQFIFDNKGIELYRETVVCKLASSDRSRYQLVYDRYQGKKNVSHKARSVKDDQIADVWSIVDELRK